MQEPSKGSFTIRKAFSEDFDRVYPLLQSFGNASISKEYWQKIFVTPWKTTEDFCGYLLLRDDDVKGYLGLIFSQRMLKDKPEHFCNMTSWIVSDDCRGQSLRMLLEVLTLKDHTITNFTASPTVATILSKLKFTEFDVHQRVLLPLPHFSFAGRNQKCDFNPQTIRKKLVGEDLRIFEDHQKLRCQHLLLQSDKGDCYVVLKKTKRKNLTWAKVHYLSNAGVFHECMERLIARICLRLRVLGVMVDERYIEGHQFRVSLGYSHQRKAFFKSESVVDKNLIDSLYSEMVILHN
jgi:hypothetical protein